MSRSLDKLDQNFRVLVDLWVETLKDQGIDVLIYCTHRSIKDQNIEYRKGRSLSDIKRKISSLRNRGFDYLANLLDNTRPQASRKRVTNAAGGESWHNYGLAIDFVPLINGKPAWSVKRNRKLWEKCILEAENIGLVCGHRWRFKDSPHIQMSEVSNPLRVYDANYLNKKFK